ncbi:hypothetical protein B0T24DRAFT_336929 [Lasiosphaeria ovina]|uniref:Uncharacterized protein n=1 Tax=Lasiosphaeria ovina TaxID=92902 RepID=A0AAE0K808_9PEZI|nr:hypothetical protein B0T24DRAFT_336929 [Lasiosphaeria ovina]
MIVRAATEGAWNAWDAVAGSGFFFSHGQAFYGMDMDQGTCWEGGRAVILFSNYLPTIRIFHFLVPSRFSFSYFFFQYLFYLFFCRLAWLSVYTRGGGHFTVPLARDRWMAWYGAMVWGSSQINLGGWVRKRTYMDGHDDEDLLYLTWRLIKRAK